MDETALISLEAETDEGLKGMNKRDRKELFQINTHPASVIAANNKRDRRLKQIVMRVVAFCKKEHEEGQQIPFRFFKKRASLMTGVSLSTIHRIETIDMKFPSSPELESPSGKSKSKNGQKKAKKKKKKENVGDEIVNVTAAPASLIQQGGSLLTDGSGLNHHHIHFQIPSAMANAVPDPTATATASAAKPAKKKKRKIKIEVGQSGGVTHNHSNNTTTIITSDLTLQPAALHAVTSVGEGGVATINVHDAIGNVAMAAATQQRTTPCTWTAGPIGPFTMGELRDNHHVQLPAGSHLQVNGQHVQAVGSAIPINAQLQPISVSAAAASQQATFTGQLDGSNLNWATGTVGAFGTLQTTATLVGQQVVQAYHNNNPAATGQPVSANTQQQQQQQQQSSLYFHF